MKGREIGDKSGYQIMQDLIGRCEDFGFYSEEWETTGFEQGVVSAIWLSF